MTRLSPGGRQPERRAASAPGSPRRGPRRGCGARGRAPAARYAARAPGGSPRSGCRERCGRPARRCGRRRAGRRGPAPLPCEWTSCDAARAHEPDDAAKRPRRQAVRRDAPRSRAPAARNAARRTARPAGPPTVDRELARRGRPDDDPRTCAGPPPSSRGDEQLEHADAPLGRHVSGRGRAARARRSGRGTREGQRRAQREHRAPRRIGAAPHRAPARRASPRAGARRRAPRDTRPGQEAPDHQRPRPGSPAG